MKEPAEPNASTWPAGLRIRAAILGYIILLLITWLTASDVLAAVCLVLLISVVLLPGLEARRLSAWLTWIALVVAVAVLTRAGQAHLVLDLVPIVVNLGLAALFAHSLRAPHTPMIARAIIAIEGVERLRLPGIAAYARWLTLAWTLIFCAQLVLFIALQFWWLPTLPAESPARAWAVGWQHVGGYLLPILFMICEYTFRRWHFRKLPHASPQRFLRQLVRNWPQLLRDAALPGERKS
ncbi:MAG: xanthomonadin biosynthesis protein [Rhodanobacteraceae bacterium]|nr:xanthomonadin biosynthesis protein [Rhodanobacteraceae bacterium]